MEKITENHPLSGSQDILADNIQKLKEIFPEVFSEGRVDFEKLQVFLGDLITPNDELYGLNWWGKNEAIRESMKRSLGTLRPDRDSSKNWDTTENIYIEGDNLEVLKLLQKSYNNKIKMIYIDPPYNTGKDFVYKDNYKDNLKNYLEQTGQVDSEGVKQSTNTKDDGRYHSNWLNMMCPRLKLARNLLKEDGVIFISIDDNEVHNLKAVCDEIFGEFNFVACLPTVMNLKGNNDQFGFAGTHEYTLVYIKDFESTEDLFGIPLEKEDYNDYKLSDEKGNYKKGATLMRTGIAGTREKRPKGFYPIYVSADLKKIYLSRKSNTDIEIFPMTKKGIEMSWRRSPETLSKSLDDFIITGKSEKISFYKKQRLEEDIINGKKPKSLFYKPDYSSGNGTTVVKNLFNDKRVFDNPKPVNLIRDFISVGIKEGVILDFFAGASTSAQSVLELNAFDGNHRKFIQVQIPEKIDKDSEAVKLGFDDLCKLGIERINRAGDKILTDKKEELQILKSKSSLLQTEEEKQKILELEEINSKLDIGFKVFKLDSSNIEAWDTEMPKTAEEIKAQLEFSRNHLRKGRTEEDLLYELLLKQGLMLTSPIEERELADAKVYSISHGELFICMNATISMAVIEGIGLWGKECIQDAIVDLKPVLVLKDEAFGKDDAFKTNAELRLLNEFGFAKVNTL